MTELDGSNPEQQARIAAAKAQSKRGEWLYKYYRWSVANLNEQIFFYIGILAVVGLLVLWLAVPSALVVYGSLGVIILLIVFWGVARIRRIHRIQKRRELQARGDLLR